MRLRDAIWKLHRFPWARLVSAHFLKSAVKPFFTSSGFEIFYEQFKSFDVSLARIFLKLAFLNFIHKLIDHAYFVLAPFYHANRHYLYRPRHSTPPTFQHLTTDHPPPPPHKLLIPSLIQRPSNLHRRSGLVRRRHWQIQRGRLRRRLPRCSRSPKPHRFHRTQIPSLERTGWCLSLCGNTVEICL